MIVARGSSLRPLQPPISDRVRKQPRQRLDAPSTTHALMQGVAMLGGRVCGVRGTVDDMNTKYDPVSE